MRAVSSSNGEFWRRLETFSHRWIDGDGHAILRFEAVMESVRQCVPEIQDLVLALGLCYVSPDGSIRDDPSLPSVPGEVVGIHGLEIHQLVHSILLDELSSNVRFKRAGVNLEMWTSIGRGFRAREIQRLLLECFESLRRMDAELAGGVTTAS